jgi:hypothetical protein
MYINVHIAACGYSTTKQQRKLFLIWCNRSRLGGSSCELCGLFGIDEFSDNGDLDVVPRTEREDENRFVVEFYATGDIAVQPRLYDAEMLVIHEYVCTD